MTHRTRRLIFYTFVLIFLIVTPGVLLYATGYSFNWDKGQVVETGSFYFKSIPANADIYINGQSQNATPSYLSRLAPGQYLIEIKKDGFFSWKKNLDIQAQMTTEARNILLTPQQPEVSLIAANATSTKDYFATPQDKTDENQAKKIASSTLTDVGAWTVSQNNIYYLQASNLILYRTDLTGTASDQISLAPLPRPKTSYTILASPANTAVFEPGGKLYLLDNNLKTFLPVADDVQGAVFSPDTEKMLYWTNHELWVVYLKDVLSQPYRSSGEKDLITRLADKITQAIWLPQTSEHIIYTVQGADGQSTIKIVELDNRDQRNTYDIYSAKDPEIYFNTADSLLYVLTEKKLYSVNILGI